MDEDKKDAIARAEREYDNLLSRLRNGKAGRQSQGLENQFGMAYQALVRLGARPQIGFRYRRQKS